MKTINPKNAFKLFLFLLIVFSAKTFSQFPNHADQGDSESKIGVTQTMKTDDCHPASRAHVMCLDGNAYSKGEVTSKFGDR